jgi:hypothetical protein
MSIIVLDHDWKYPIQRKKQCFFLFKNFMEIPYLAIAIFHYDAKLLNHYQYQLINNFFL